MSLTALSRSASCLANFLHHTTMGDTTSTKQGNPAVVGLAGFGMTTLLLQFHNLGWIGLGPVVWMGLIFGGTAQLIAGLMEKSLGNSFGFSAFTAYGAFWISLCGIFFGNEFNLWKAAPMDMALYLLVWGGYTTIMLAGALRIHKAMTVTFATLALGFFLLSAEFFAKHAGNTDLAHTLKTVAAWELIFCALSALYMLTAIIVNETAGRQVLPFGAPVIR